MAQNMGTRIRERRMALEMTLAELGKKVRVGASTVRKWETGYIKDIRSDKIQRVATALEVTPAYLMGWDESRNVNVDTVCTNNGLIGHAHAAVTFNGKDSEPLSKEEAEILRIYKALGVKGRMKLLATAMELEAEEATV